MRLEHLVTAFLLLLTIPVTAFPLFYPDRIPKDPTPGPKPKPVPEKGWRDYHIDDGNPHYARFAQYKEEHCLNEFGKHAPDYMDFSPLWGRCYNVDETTVSIYQERGGFTSVRLYPEKDCGGEYYVDHGYQNCQNAQRKWAPYRVRSFKML